MNIMFKIAGEIYTAPIEGTVLPGVTRDSMIHLLRDWGYKVNETRLSVDDLMKAGHDGTLEEVFGKVEKGLKLDPKNTELLAQKQTLLKEAVAATSEKLDVLKSAEAQVQKQFENGEVSEEQYRALQREIVKTEADLKNLKTAAEDSNSTLEKVGEIAGKIGEKSEALGKKLLPVTGAIAGIGTASIAAFNELDAGYDTIITKTGASG